MQRALALGRLGMRLSAMRAAPFRAAAAVPRPSAAAPRRSLRVLASATPGSSSGSSGLGASSSSGADEALTAQRRRLLMQAFARQHGTAAGAQAAEAAAAGGAAGGQQGRGMLRRLLLSGAAAVALLAAAAWPRPAAAFQGPGGLFGGRPPAAEAVPVTMENKVWGWGSGKSWAGLAQHAALAVACSWLPCLLPPPRRRPAVPAHPGSACATAHPTPCRRRCRTCPSCCLTKC